MKKIIAIFGWPLSHTLSPKFQNAGLKAAGVDARYLRIPASPAAFLAKARAMQALPEFLGANVTNPHKIAAMELADKLTPEAKAIGAVNTLFRQGKRWIGHNTDSEGFTHSLGGASEIKGKRVVVFGAGGAARAVVHASLQAGAKGVFLACRNRERGRELEARFGKKVVAFGLEREFIDGLAVLGDIVVNTVPGAPFAARLGKALASIRGQTICDISYRTSGQPLLAAARKLKLKAVDGREMLLEQGVLSFRCFTAKPAPYAVMRKALFGRG